MTPSAVGSGAYVSFHSGAFLLLSPTSSCLTHSGFLCLRSRRKLVSSQRSRRAVIGSSTHGAFVPTAILIESVPSATAVPISMHVTPLASNAPIAAPTSSGATSRTMPASSLKSVPTSPAPGQVSGTTTLTLQLPAKAISRSVVTSPPSDRSWPDRTVPFSMRSWTARKVPLSGPKSSTSGLSLPIWPYTWARLEPPHLAFPQPRSTNSRAVLPPHRLGHLRSGVTVFRTSGHVT
mmetsp:Transcript_11358/g.26601  ORF Transcript_11358/g.26601 Transcript_11358/m.26601 type:complete len:235 (-) Transcript_11358:1041-1745(-)